MRAVLRTVIKSTSAIINTVQFQYCGQYRGKRCITIPDLKTPFLEGLGKKLVSHNRVLIYSNIYDNKRLASHNFPNVQQIIDTYRVVLSSPLDEIKHVGYLRSSLHPPRYQGSYTSF